MLKSLIITAIIILCNALFFFYGGYERISEQAYRTKEILPTLYKVIIYAGPMFICILFRDKSWYKDSLVSKFKWFKEKWVYLLRIGYLVLLLLTKKIGAIDFGTYSLFYVLVVNSVVEETVFRGYIQQKLVAGYGRIRGIIGQAILFGIIHIPFYYTHYQAGLYDQMNAMIGGFLPIDSLGPFVVLFALGTPIVLGLLWGWIMNKTRSLRPSIVWHSIHNGILLFL